MNENHNFTEEELESMADKLLEEASANDLASQTETELPKPRKRAAKKKENPEPVKNPEERLAELLEKGRKNGKISAKELECLEEMNLDGDRISKFYETLEQNGIEVDVPDDLPPIDEDLPDAEELVEIEQAAEELTDTDSMMDSLSTDDPVRMYLKEIGKVPLLTAEEELELAKSMVIDEKAVQQTLLEIVRDAGGVPAEVEAVLKELSLNAEDHKRFLHQIREAGIEPHAEERPELPEAHKAEMEALRRQIKEAKNAKHRMTEANLRLVVSIAKRYVGRGMLFLDLIQEGNLGLIKAVEKFDYTKGYKFSTYATWWIRQAITRAIADQARTIRIPVHMVETINKTIRVSRQLLQELGHDPSAEEIAEEMNMPVDKVRDILKIAQEPVSLETPIGEEEDSHLGDFIPDEDASEPSEAASFSLLREQLEEVLDTLAPREKKVLELRFGIEDGRTRTLEEVGKEFKVTRERIRQIEAKALRKLRHPSRSKKLRDFLN